MQDKMDFLEPRHALYNMNNDATSSPHAPLLDPSAPTSTGEPPVRQRRRRLRPSTVVLLLLAGLLGLAAVFVVTTLVIRDGNEHNDDRKVPTPPETRRSENGIAADRGVAEGVSSKSFRPLLGAPPYAWSDKLLAWQRTAFHFQPKKNWMNDPNGPVLYNGWYHLFYQYNPYGAVWGNIVWGHAVSRDLIQWHHLPIAMVPDNWYDINGVWTGSATILEDGQLVMLYTGSTNESVQVQNLAYPANPSDPLLIDWVKYSGNPVLVPPRGIRDADFRDPTTAWLTPEGKWRFIIGSKVNKTGIALVYDTKDFKNIELLDEEFHGVPKTGMWECVDFYPVSTVGENGLDKSDDGPNVKHVVKTSLDDERNDYYALGTYNDSVGIWIPDEPTLDVGIGLRYDYGIFYASKTFYDQEKKRRVLWGWVKETDSEKTDIQKGWASIQTIPRTIVFDNKTGKNLLQWPVEEVEKLRAKKDTFQKVEVKPGSVVPIDVPSTSELDIVVEFEVDQEASERINGKDKTYNCSTSGGAAERHALGPFGLLIYAYKDLTEQTPVYFYISKDHKGNFKTFFCADHSRSSEANDVDKSIYGSTVPVLKGEKLSMRVLVDHSIVESFAQGGRTCITSRVYPTKAIDKDAQVFVFNNATEATITASLRMWQMSSAYAYSYAPFLCFFAFLITLF